MASPWTFIYRHRNPDHPELEGRWPTEADARHCNGLVLVPFYDPNRQAAIWGWWELRHQVSNDPILFIRADTNELAEEYGAKVAEMANWGHMRSVPEWTAPPHSRELIAYLNSTREIFFWPNFEGLWAEPVEKTPPHGDWEESVPFGEKAHRQS